VVAHRLSTIQNADRIIVIENASIVEEGSHDELMALDGHYAALVRSQFEPAEHVFSPACLAG
jgi:ABC-type multidrug transport system fused ATPase/permease subunit